MATSSSKTLDHWREVFRTAGEPDVFRVIRQAIRVAASTHPDEFRSRRDKIVQTLLTALPPRVEKADEGHRDAVKAMEEEKSGRGNPVKSVGALSATRTTPPSAVAEPPRAAVPVADVVEEKAETTTKREETWKIVSVSANGKIRLRRVVVHDDDQTKKPSKPAEHEHQVPADEPGNDLRSNLEAAKRRLSEGWTYSCRSYEPRPKKFCRPLQFRISGARLR